MLLAFTTSLVGMQKKITRKERQLIEQKKQIPGENIPPLDYYEKLRSLETRLNKFINMSKDYKSTHNLIIIAIENDPHVIWKDKQELYDHYEEILYKKFEHLFKKSPTR